jgi:putative ABC transport system permease protein
MSDQVPQTVPWVLRWLVQGELREAVVGDLQEELSRRERPESLGARLWYWRQVLGIGWHFLKESLRTTPTGNWAGQSSGGLRKPEKRRATVRELADNVAQDVQFALRQLRKSPGFAVVAILALGLGIATNTTIFSLANAVLLKPLPYKDADQIVLLRAHILPQIPQLNTSGPELIFYRRRSKLFDQIAAYSWAAVNLTRDGEPEELEAGMVSANFFQTLGVQAAIGTAMLPDADKGEDTEVVVLSNGLWRRRFGGDPGIVGRKILLDGQTRAVIGVMPASFQMLQTSAASPNNVDVWIPQTVGYERLPLLDHNLLLLARRKAGVTLAEAQAEMNGVSEQLSQTLYGFAKLKYGVDVLGMYEEVVKGVRPALRVLLGGVAFVLLIASVNVANLLLARAVGRQREIAIRTTLGASRGRLISQLLTESLVLALSGGAVGLFLSMFGLRVLRAIAPANIPRLSELSLDGNVLLFAIAAAVLTGVAFGLAPAIESTRPNLNETMNDGGKGMTGGVRGRWVRKVLLAVEVALALISLTGAGLMIRSFRRLQEVNPGFTASNVLTAELGASPLKYQDAQVASFYSQLLDRLRALPGVESAGGVSVLPLTGKDSSQVIGVDVPTESQKITTFQAQYRSVTPDYFSTMKIPLLAGRYFSQQDGAAAPKVAIINDDCAKRLWPGQNPLGRRLNLMSDAHAGKPWAKIVGIVGETKDLGLDTKEAVQVFMPSDQRAERRMTIVMRTAKEPLRTAGALRLAVWSIDREQPVAEIRAMDQILYVSVARPRFNTILLGVFAGLATMLGAIGIYGLMSYSVSQRTQEIGIRMALGARREDVARTVLVQELRAVLAGVGLGLLGAAAATRLMRTLLFGVTPTDAVTFLVVPVLIVAVAMVASYLPVRRATRIDPLTALRYE